MWERRFCRKVANFAAGFLVLVLLCGGGLVTAHASKGKSPWLTLTGNAPAVVAKGGFSGLFPDSSLEAFSFTYDASSPDTISLCDLQLTKDRFGVCLPTMLLDNCTNINFFYPNGTNTYSVNGVPTSGWFSVDYDFKTLGQVSVLRSTLSRSEKFDGLSAILLVEEVRAKIKSSALWLNVQHDMFYRQHNLSMRSYLLSVSKKIVVDYVSSPEVAFLKNLGTRLGNKTKLIFRFLGEDVAEPSMNQTYGSLVKNLTFIRSFASGILVPKHYIWPMTSDLYLQPHTSIVMDAHKVGLEIFASDFANDGAISYNYSYDAVAEYLSFIDNGIFVVDGVLTDFPSTASEAIGCFSHIKKNGSEQGKPVVITHNGASGIYPDCTDLAYQQAVEDGADIIDCPVQVTKDGTLICMSSINLMDTTTVASSSMRSRLSMIPEIQGTAGIFSFNLTWDEIQMNLRPAISNPELDYRLLRNPRYKNAGNFIKLSDFLAYAKGQALSGILIDIEHAAFLAEYLGYSVTDAVIKTLTEAGYKNLTAQKVMIQSTNSSVLTKFKQQTGYTCIYKVDESISDADASSIADIKKFASSVAVNKNSVYPENRAFITGQTDLVKNLQSAGFSVFVYVLRNEFTSQPWDFYADPIAEINSFVQGTGVDGIITEFPGTAARYKRNSCLKLEEIPSYMLPVPVGILIGLINPSALPPALAPQPVLDAADVVEPPLPPAVKPISTPPTYQPSAGTPQRLAAAAAAFSLSCSIATLVGSLLIWSF